MGSWGVQGGASSTLVEAPNGAAPRSSRRAGSKRVPIAAEASIQVQGRRSNGFIFLSAHARGDRPGRGRVALPLHRRRRAAADRAGRIGGLAAVGTPLAAPARRALDPRSRRGRADAARAAPVLPEALPPPPPRAG